MTGARKGFETAGLRVRRDEIEENGL